MTIIIDDAWTPTSPKEGCSYVKITSDSALHDGTQDSGTWVISTDMIFNVYVIGGGGGGSPFCYAGGGGAGGVVYKEKISIPSSGASIPLKIGLGSTSPSENQVFANNGGDSELDTFIGYGGGAGACYHNYEGIDGGCGGGGCDLTGYGGTSTQTSSQGDLQYGNSGGTGKDYSGGGGGGAGGPGGDSGWALGGNGGEGIEIWGDYYAGGGGGAGGHKSTREGGPGGSGVGGDGGGLIAATSAVENTGSGCGSGTDCEGLTGANGVILIEILPNQPIASHNGISYGIPNMMMI